MKLKDWLIKEGLTVTEFARRMGKPQPTIARYVSGDRMPEKEAMRQIMKMTRGKVQPNDFYEAA
jgi:transcriptional regulator with XRE-family HTH domain